MPEYWSSGSCSHLHGIVPTQGSNPGLPHCRQILYQLSQPGKPNTGEGGLPLLQGIFLTQESNRGLLHCRQILYQQSYQGSPNMGRCKSSKLQLITSHWNIHSQELLDFCKSSNNRSKETEKEKLGEDVMVLETEGNFF